MLLTEKPRLHSSLSPLILEDRYQAMRNLAIALYGIKIRIEPL